MSNLDEFLAGERLDDVVFYLSDAYLDDDSRLRNVGTETDGGVRLILDGETGRSAFQAGTGMGAMEFAKTAMGAEGGSRDCSTTGRVRSPRRSPTTIEIRFIFAFAEAQK